MHTLQLRQHPKVRFIKHRERGLATILGRISRRLRRDHATIGQIYASQPHIDATIRFRQRCRASIRRQHVTDSVIRVSRLTQLSSETQNFRTLHGNPDRLTDRVPITPRRHLASNREMIEPHGAESFRTRHERGKLRLRPTLRPGDHATANTPPTILVNLIAAQNERGKLIVKHHRRAFNIARAMHEKSLDPINDLQT